ncbi:hypothetical protein ACIDI_59c00290 [Acidiphilium sp. JA12-A1]|nr:hypothetical protein ACIDI_59c00290 [Acidiphilium sp. JA12-A1]
MVIRAPAEKRPRMRAPGPVRKEVQMHASHHGRSSSLARNAHVS